MPHIQFVIVTLLLLATFVTARGADTDWKAGAAKVVITPDKYMWMAGYGSRDRPAEGKSSELWAKALVLEDAEGDRGVVITLDLVGIDRLFSQGLCRSLSQEYGFKRDQIAICTSHTHSGPVVGRNLGPLHYLVVDETQRALIEEYAQALQRRVMAVVGDAVSQLAPCSLAWGNGHTNFAVNRRENTPYGDVPKWRTEGALKGPCDHDVPVLSVRDAEGQLKAVVFGYACHATTLSFYNWSADYPGHAQTELESWHPGCVAMFWAGCGADQNPLPRSTVELAQHYGRRLADAVDAVLLTTAMSPIPSDLESSYTELDLPLGELPTREQIEQDAASSNKFVAARAKHLLEQLAQGPLPATYPYPVGVWRLGSDVQFISLGGEVVVDYAIRLKAELAGPRTWVAGYSHDVMAYIPSRRVLAEGGYEGGGAMVYYGLATVWAPEVENMIVHEAHRQLEAGK